MFGRIQIATCGARGGAARARRRPSAPSRCASSCCVVDGDNVATPKYVTLGPVVDGLRVVTAGLEADDRVIVNGLMRVRPGVKVTPQQAAADAGGVRAALPYARQLRQQAAMRISHFFIDRPIFAGVISIVFVILGARVASAACRSRSIPRSRRRSVNVTGQYPGASAEVVASTVVAPLEQQINGVENMLYISSNSTGDGRFSISVTFDLGTNLDIAQVQVQNRVAIAQPRLPADVRNIGVTVAKASPDLMMVVHLLFARQVARHALHLQLRQRQRRRRAEPHRGRRLDHRVRRPRLLDARVARSRPAAVARADGRRRRRRRCSAQNVQVAVGRAESAAGRRSRAPSRSRCRRSAGSPTRSSSPTSSSSRATTAVVRLKDVARVELAALDYGANSYLDRDPAVGLGIFQLPGSNALATAKTIKATMDGAVEGASRPGSSTPSSTTRPSSSSSRSTPSSRRSSRRSSSSCWS